MKKPLLFLIVFICATALFGQSKKGKPAPAAAEPAKPSALDKTTLENYVRHLETWDTTISMEISDPKPSPIEGFYEVTIHASKNNASQDLSLYVSKDGRQILQGTLYTTVDNPFKPDLDKLKGATDHAANYGTQGAPVVIVEFSDFQCPFCKEEAKTLRSNIPSTYPKEVHLYHLDMPLELAHPWARAGAIAGRCVYKQSNTAFWNYYDWIYDHQSDITTDNLKAKVLEWAKDKDSVDSLQFTRCLDNKETDAEVTSSADLAKSLQISQTPMFFINGRRMAGAIDWPTMKHVIDDEIQYQKTAKNAGEDCGCSMTLPTPGAPAATPLGGLK
jgi:protein-disulfide isomerase